MDPPPNPLLVIRGNGILVVHALRSTGNKEYPRHRHFLCRDQSVSVLIFLSILLFCMRILPNRIPSSHHIFPTTWGVPITRPLNVDFIGFGLDGSMEEDGSTK